MTKRTVVGRNVGNPRHPPHKSLFAMLGWAVPILAVAALFVAVAPHVTRAQPLEEENPSLTITAGSSTYGYQIDNVVFTVTRTGPAEEEIGGSVTMTQDDT